MAGSSVGNTAALVATIELKDKFTRVSQNVERSLDGLERKTSTIGRIGDEAGRGLRNAGANMVRFGAIAAVGVGGGLVAATRAAIDFEDAFAGIRKTVDEADLAAAGLTFDDLSDSIRAMAREIPIAATELSAIGEAAGALGIAGGDITQFTEVVAKLGVTTDLTSETAAEALGHLGTILGLTGDDFENLADSLVALGNDGASTESQIIAITERFAASGRSAGLATEDILALSSTAASMGIEVEAAGSSLSRLFDSVTTNIGTSNVRAKAFADSLGLSAAEFRDAWEKDALGTFQEFLGALNELDQFQAADLLKKVGITGVRDVRAIKLMAGGVEELNDQLETSRNATGALGEEAAKKFETTASQIQILKNNLADVGITIGSAVLPKITELTTQFAAFLNQDDVQAAIKEFAAGIPGVIDEVVALAKGVPWGAIGTSLQIAGTGAKALLTAFTSLPPWIQTAVLTGWGLNKLTGGALGNIGKITIEAFRNRGATPANPLFTKEVGLGGAGGAPIAGGGGALGTILKGGVAVALGAVIGAHVADAINEGTVSGARDFATGQVEAVLDSKDAGRIERAIRVIEDQLNPDDFAAKMALALDVNGVRTTLEGQLDALKGQLGAMGISREQASEQLARTSALKDAIGIANSAQVGELRSMKADVTGGLTTLRATTLAASQHNTQKLSEVKAETMALHNPLRAIETVERDTASAVRTTAAGTAAHLARIEGATRDSANNTAAVARKNFSPTLSFRATISNTVSVDSVLRAITSNHIATDFRGGLSEL